MKLTSKIMHKISHQPLTSNTATLLARLLMAGVFMAFLLAGSNLASAQLTPLTLINGWTGAPFGTNPPAVEKDGNIVRFRGAMATSGTNPFAFDMPAVLVPKTDVYIPVDLCHATKGRLHISSSGSVDVEAENGAFNNAQCFTSLDGATFVLNPNGVPLTLINGWKEAPFKTSHAWATTAGTGIDAYYVYLKGAIASGTTPNPFVLPDYLSPPETVFIPVDLCEATNGRLEIDPDGTVTIQAESGDFSNAQCFTSLDGVGFATTQVVYTQLTLINGWTNTFFGTGKAEVSTTIGKGVVTFKGAIASGTTPNPFVLPASFRPAANVYLHVDLCDATNGRLIIQPDGTVTIQAENGNFGNAQCFTSLDGVSFVP